MKIFILAPANIVHTQRWVLSLAERGHKIFLFSFHNVPNNVYLNSSNVQIYGCGINNARAWKSKFNYLTFLHKLKRKIKEFSPDILHAHYASSYGLLGALAGFHPYIISVWGSDVYDFPQMNFLFKKILCYNLNKADCLLSTSHVMATETSKYTSKPIQITPFGVDVNLFQNIPSEHKLWNADFIVGNVKSLAPKYGIDVLIKAFKHLMDNNPELNALLVIVGDGPNRQEYVSLSKDLGIEGQVLFVGKVPNHQLPLYYSNFSVAVFPSILESFGVVAVESMACECPVVTSDAVGFTEVVVDGKTGFIVPKRDIEATSRAIQQFVDNPNLRNEIGKEGRKRVLKYYNWKNNVDDMASIYQNILSAKKHK